MNNETSIEKVCSFSVSDLHLVTMLLPYLDNKIKTGEKFITIFEKDLEVEVKLVLSRLTLNRESKENLLSINWNTSDLYIYEQMSKEIYNACNESFKLSILVNGSKEFIDSVNSNLKGFFDNNVMKKVFKVINCYDITKLDEDIKTILKTHDRILNTSGEKNICEVFEGYEKKLA